MREDGTRGGTIDNSSRALFLPKVGVKWVGSHLRMAQWPQTRSLDDWFSWGGDDPRLLLGEFRAGS
jgi:hypothetical protein